MQSVMPFLLFRGFALLAQTLVSALCFNKGIAVTPPDVFLFGNLTVAPLFRFPLPRFEHIEHLGEIPAVCVQADITVTLNGIKGGEG